MGGFGPRNVIAAYDAGALDLMLKLVDSSVAGERAAAATTLRNICVEDEKYRESFVKLGGIQALVNQLDTKPDPSLNHADVQLEAVLNLQDMVETEDGQTIAEYAKLAVKAGAIPKLQQLEKSDDEEVRFTDFHFSKHFVLFVYCFWLYLFIYTYLFICIHIFDYLYSHLYLFTWCCFIFCPRFYRVAQGLNKPYSLCFARFLFVVLKVNVARTIVHSMTSRTS